MSNEAYTSDQLRHIAEGLDNANSGCERLAEIFYAAVKADKARHSLQQAEPVAWRMVSHEFCQLHYYSTEAEANRAADNYQGWAEPLYTSPALPAGQWVKAEGGENWPNVGFKYLVKINGVVQQEVFEFDQGDDGMGGGEYFWSREDLDEDPVFNPESDEWLPLSTLGYRED